jgi:alpha-1,2-glucosyltransferase
MRESPISDNVSTPEVKASHTSFWLLLGFVVLAALVMLWILPAKPIADELIHLPQIQSFMAGSMVLNGIVAMPPGFHLTIASIANLLGLQELRELRVINAAITLICPLLFWMYLVSEKSKLPTLRSTQILLSPIVWPFFFLLYTDLSSLLLVLTGMVLIERRHFKIAALVCTFSLAFRQNNIFWAVLIWLIAMGDSCSISSLLEDRKSSFKDFLKKITPFLKKTFLFVTPLIAFAIFIFLNGGVAMGNKDLHQASGLYPTQVFFCLLVLWLVLLPMHINNLGSIFVLLKARPWLILLLAALGVAYYLSFDISHPYNFPSDYFIRNWVLYKLKDHQYWRLIAFIPMAWALLSLMVTSLEKRSYYWLYPITFASLLPVHLIEQRYYIIPLVLLMLFRVPMSKKWESILLIWTILLSTLVSYGIISMKLFL